MTVKLSHMHLRTTHTYTPLTILDLRAEIDAVTQRFIDAVNKHDVTAISQVYASDCKLMPPGMDVQYGREGISSTRLKLALIGLHDILKCME